MDFSVLSDEDLIKFIRNATPEIQNEGLREIIRRYSSHIFTYLLRFSHDRNSVENLMQETFIKVWKNMKQFNEKLKFKVWLFRIAHNAAVDEYRKKMRKPEMSIEALQDEDSEPLRNAPSDPTHAGRDPLESFTETEKREIILGALESMNPVDRQILVLREIHEFTYDEIAEVLSMPVGTVKSRLNRARNLFKQYFSHLKWKT